ncbi:MAG: hypothetical protein JNM68_16300 [Dinghuibacter sp.]|nr:hypothetical protein [Dinghuibacter sp.]
MQLPVVTEQKVQQIIAELKKNGLWKKDPPGWVSDYEQRLMNSEDDFLGWLQFVYLPNYHVPASTVKRNYIVPQAVRFFGEDVRKGELLRLLIELDALL